MVKILCLGGLGYNEKTFELHFCPSIANELQSSCDVAFQYFTGAHPMNLVDTMDDSLGRPPHFSYLESSWPGATDEQFFRTALRVPNGLSPEEVHHWIERVLPSEQSPLLADVIERLRTTFDKHGPFDCIFGYSDGAKIAATFLVDYLRKLNRTERSDRQVKCAVFMNGGAPFSLDRAGYILADEVGQIIDIPTCHILAYNDTILPGSLTLFNLCGTEDSTLLDYGKAHSIPRDPKSTKIIANGIRDLLEKANVIDTAA